MISCLINDIAVALLDCTWASKLSLGPAFWPQGLKSMKRVVPEVSGNLQVPNGAAGYFLLGQICKMTRRPEKAIEHFSIALRLDVLMWSAYEELCSLGAAPCP